MNIPPYEPEVSQTYNEPKIVQTDAGATDGQNKCPKSGTTDISLNVNTVINNIINTIMPFDTENSVK